MSWKDLLDSGSERVFPWYGFRRIHDAQRTWTISGSLPPEHGWFLFDVGGGRDATLKSREPQPADLHWAGNQPRARGYLVGDRFIPDNARVDPDPAKLVQQTLPVHCCEGGLERFARISAARDRDGLLVYVGQEFPEGADAEAIKAYQDRVESLDHIAGVTPALDLAFRWTTYQRKQAEERRRELERLREEERVRQEREERIREAMRSAGTAAGRRVLATHDFETAAREALRVSGAELLDTRQSFNKNEMVVQYRFQQRRLECVVERRTLRVVDAGVCLTDHDTGVKGDTFFTLESLPGVIGEAMRLGKLVVWRHLDGDEEPRARWPYDGPEDDDD